MKKLILLLLIASTISGQTVTEKIKAKFKQINDAKIERLKECEELKFNNAPQESARIGSQGTEYFRKYDLVEATIYNADIPESKDAYLLTLSSIIKLWNEYAKECYADSTLLYTASEIDEEKEKEWHKQNPDGSKIWVFTKPKNIYISKQPDPIEFIEFLRNKLGEK